MSDGGPAARGQGRGDHLAPDRKAGDPVATGWVAWIFFAGAILALTGTFHIMQGLAALFGHRMLSAGQDRVLVTTNYTVWGWLHVALGVLAIAAGVGMMVGQLWARVIGIVLAVVSAVASLAFAAAYPVWAVVTIALDIVVIYSLAVHGRELKDSLAPSR